MPNAIIIHGAYGNPQENWFPWLKGELEKLGFTVYVPGFPTPEGQTLSGWTDAFKPYEKYLNSETILIGHSIGATFLLNILNKHAVKATFLVSGFIDYLDNKDFDSINESFFKGGFDWDAVKKNCQTIHVYHSDNDPYVPLQKSRDMASHLGIDVRIVKGGGHFNKDAGYTRFDALLDDIKSVL